MQQIDHSMRLGYADCCCQIVSTANTRLIALQLHQRMKADAEWSAIEAKVCGNDSDYKVGCVMLLIIPAARCHTRAFGSLRSVLTDMVLLHVSCKDLIVLCYIATMASGNDGTKASTDAGHLDASTLLPSQGNAASERVVGTLDLNIGKQ